MSIKYLAGVKSKRYVCSWGDGCCACFSAESFPHFKNGKKHQKLPRSGRGEINVAGRVGIHSQALAADVWFHRKICISSHIRGSKSSNYCALQGLLCFSFCLENHKADLRKRHRYCFSAKVFLLPLSASPSPMLNAALPELVQASPHL